MDIKDRLINGNIAYIDKINANQNKKEALHALIKGQSPFALIVTCSDSRVVPEKIFDCNEGELFVIRSAGNVINEGELASIEYGIEHLHVPYILILGHTHCGAVHAALNKEKGHFLAPIIDRISLISGNSEYEVSINNALNQALYLKEKFHLYDGQIKAGIYDIETNLVTIVE